MPDNTSIPLAHRLGCDYFTYMVGASIWAEDPPFYAVIQAAMRGADTQNARALRHIWPDVWDSLQARYDAPGGRLDGDPKADVDSESMNAQGNIQEAIGRGLLPDDGGV